MLKYKEKKKKKKKKKKVESRYKIANQALCQMT